MNDLTYHFALLQPSSNKTYCVGPVERNFFISFDKMDRTIRIRTYVLLNVCIVEIQECIADIHTSDSDPTEKKRKSIAFVGNQVIHTAKYEIASN